jgi:hypothetical protein
MIAPAEPQVFNPASVPGRVRRDGAPVSRRFTACAVEGSWLEPWRRLVEFSGLGASFQVSVFLSLSL